MKSLKALRFVATAMLAAGTLWAMESKTVTAAATASSTASSSTSSTTAIVEHETAVSTQTPSSTLQSAKTPKPRLLDKIVALRYLVSIDLPHHLIHECGHALMALLCGADSKYIKVFLFSDQKKTVYTLDQNNKKWLLNRSDAKEPKVKFGFIYSYGDSSGSYAEVWHDVKRTKINNILIRIAGGTAELCVAYAVFSTAAFLQAYTNTKDIKTAVIFALTRALTPYQNILEQKGLGLLELTLRLSGSCFMLDHMCDTARYAFLPDTDCLIGDGSSAWRDLLDLSLNSDENFKENRIIKFLSSTGNIIKNIGPYCLIIKNISTEFYYILALGYIRPTLKIAADIIDTSVVALPLTCIIINGANAYLSHVYGKPTTIFHIAWEKIGRPVSNVAYNTLTAPINTITNPKQYAPYPKAKTTLFMQAMYHCLRNKGSQAWDTVKGWFSCRKPKAA